MQRLHARGDDDVAGAEALATTTSAGSKRSTSTLRSDTVLLAGSTTQTAGVPFARGQRGGRNRRSPGVDSSCIVPVTVAPSRIAPGDRSSPTLTSKVRVDRIGLRRDLAHPADRRARWIVGEGDGDLGIAARAAWITLRRNVEHGVAPALARDLQDHLPGLHHLARLGAARGHDPAASATRSVKVSCSRAVSS